MKATVWYNKNISSLQNMVEIVKQNPAARELRIIVSHPVSGALPCLTADEAFIEPDIRGDAYVDWCIDFCRSHLVDLFIPRKGQIDITRRRDEFLPTKVLSTASPDYLDLIENKGAFTRAIEHEIPVAKTIEVRDKLEFTAAYAEIATEHPYVCIKPSVSIFGLGFRVIDNNNHNLFWHILHGEENRVNINDLFNAMTGYGVFSPSLLVMEYLSGDEWSVDCLAKNGELIHAIQRLKPKTSSAPQTIDDNHDIDAMVRALTKRFELNGIFNIQFRRRNKSEQSDICVLEINTRASGGAPAACASGVNLPFDSIMTALDNNYQPPKTKPVIGLPVHQAMIPRIGR